MRVSINGRECQPVRPGVALKATGFDLAMLAERM
jgi:hypothetical protein